MSQLMPRIVGGTVSNNAPDGFSRSEGKQLQAATNREIAAGIIANTRMTSAAFVTNSALNHTASLIRTAYNLTDEGDQYAAAMMHTILEGWVTYARNEIEGMGGGFGGR